MDFSEYQEKAALTTQNYSENKDENMMIPLLGIAGEAGSLLAEFKKKIRDKQSYEGFERKAKEEIGDILWYLSCVATMLNLSLDEIALGNLNKTQERWPLQGLQSEISQPFDEEFPESEQLPREMTIRIWDDPAIGKSRILWLENNKEFGDPLTNNAYEDDGYRFHDVFHLAHLCVLGWSPVMRKLLGRKRKSAPLIDEIEDGARAAIIEELIVAFVYSNARERNFYKDIKHVDTEMLFNIKTLVAHLEVKRQKTSHWEQAILQGYVVFRRLLSSRDVTFKLNMIKKELEIVSHP